MQLRTRTLSRWWVTLGLLGALMGAGRVAADGEVDVGTMVYFEPGDDLHMVVVSPVFDIQGAPHEALTLRAGYEADVVSGASVAIVDGGDPDVITSATLLDDVRHTARAGLELRDEYSSLSLEYSFGLESDYQSHGFSIAARTELFERNTAFSISYARGFDGVCSLRQDAAQEAVDRRPLPGSEGCFGGDDRVTLDLDLHTVQLGWTQAWTPIFTTQLTLTGQVLHGFQSNPYRAVWLGSAAAQEHHPENRARYAVAAASKLWLRRLRGALGVDVRLYQDSWEVRSFTGQLGYEQHVSDALRLRVAARYYLQSSASFYSDDYVTRPRGQYFTGDRELSEMSSWDVGARLTYDVPADDEGKVAFLDGLRLVVSIDYILYEFPSFHYGNVAVPNDQALVAALALEGTF